MKSSHIAYKLLALCSMLAFVIAILPISAVNAAQSTQSLTIKSSSDTYVNQASPKTNYGKTTTLQLSGSPINRGYVAFNVTAASIKGRIISGAYLRLYSTSSSQNGFSIYRIPAKTLSETKTTFTNAPALGARVGVVGSFAASKWIYVNISSQVTKAGVYIFALNSNGSAASLASRQAGANAPQLVLNLLVPTPKPTNTKIPTRTPLPTKTKVPTKIPAPTKTAAPAQPSNGAPYGVAGSWKLKFSDEFNSGRLDLSKWEPNWLAGNSSTISKPINGSEESCYDPALVSVGAFGGASGAMKLSAVSRSCRASNGTTYKAASGMVTTSGKFTFTHGYMEARVWLDGSSSTKNWPAFWADGTGSWPTTGEIDVMEGLGGRPAWHFHWGSSGSPQQVGGAPSVSKVGWHIYGADWEAGSIKFYYDGKLVGTAASGVTNAPMFLILNYGVSSSISGPIQLPSSFLVDYVRVWQH